MLAAILGSSGDKPKKNFVRFASDPKISIADEVDLPKKRQESNARMRNENILLSVVNVLVYVHKMLDFDEIEENDLYKNKSSAIRKQLKDGGVQNYAYIINDTDLQQSTTVEKCVEQMIKWIEVCEDLSLEQVDKNAFRKIHRYVSSGALADQSVELTAEQELKIEFAKLGAKISRLSKGRMEDQRTVKKDSLTAVVDRITRMQHNVLSVQRYELSDQQRYNQFLNYIGKLIGKSQGYRLQNQDFTPSYQQRESDLDDLRKKMERFESFHGEQRYLMSEEKKDDLFFAGILKRVNRCEYSNQSCEPREPKSKSASKKKDSFDEFGDLIEMMNARRGMTGQHYMK